MSKTSLFATSLIGAIPGLILSYLCVMAFLNYAGGSSILLKATTGLLLMVGLTMPVLSVMALLSGRGDGSAKKSPKNKDKKGEKKGKKSNDDEDAEVVADADSDSAMTGEIAESSELIDLDDEGIGDDVFADEEPVAPKKKKKK